MKFSIRLLYLYLFSFVGLLIVVIGSVQLVDLGIKSAFFQDVDVYDYSFPKPVCPEGQDCQESESDEQVKERAITEARKSRQRQLSNALSMIMVGTPLYMYHWHLIGKEKHA